MISYQQKWPCSSGLRYIMYIVSITIISSSTSSITIYINTSPKQISSGNYLNIGDEPPYK